jgi:hypothetical protein
MCSVQSYEMFYFLLSKFYSDPRWDNYKSDKFMGNVKQLLEVNLLGPVETAPYAIHSDLALMDILQLVLRNMRLELLISGLDKHMVLPASGCIKHLEAQTVEVLISTLDPNDILRFLTSAADRDGLPVIFDVFYNYYNHEFDGSDPDIIKQQILEFLKKILRYLDHEQISQLVECKHLNGKTFADVCLARLGQESSHEVSEMLGIDPVSSTSLSR